MSLYSDLQNCKIESEVASIYNSIFTTELGVTIETKNNCDAYFMLADRIPVLVEYKFNENFNNRVSLVKVFTQVLFYIKSLKEPPLITIIADVNEFMVINNAVLFGYLDEDIDWAVNPSIAPKCNQLLLDKMLLDPNLMKTIVYPIKEATSSLNLVQLITLEGKNALIYYINDCISKFKSSKAKDLDKQISKFSKNLSLYIKD